MSQTISKQAPFDLSESRSAPSKRVAFYTLGCRLNFSESGALAQGFVERGHTIVKFGEEADFVFINTCTVTHSAEATCRHLIRKAKRANPKAKLIVAGCYAQTEAKEISKIPGVDFVLGTTEKYNVFDHIHHIEGPEERSRPNKKSPVVAIELNKTFKSGATSKSLGGQTRAFLKIQDGCNYVCSFCIIPFARGRSRAISISEAKKKATTLLAQGFREIVLTGVNIGEYEEASKEKLSDLIAELLALKGLERLRLSSVEPNTITDELLCLLASSPKVLPHFHLPLQSGSNAILKAMRRKYSAEDYKNVVAKVFRYFPKASLGADIIVGFPGESEEQFLQTYHLAEELPLTHFHVFPYSERKNTTAARIKNPTPPSVKQKRVKKLLHLGDQKLSTFAKKQVGMECPVLFEDQDERGIWRGYTPSFLRVHVQSQKFLHNQIFQILLQDYRRGQLWGEFPSSPKQERFL